jgi:hypothetical protein
LDKHKLTKQTVTREYTEKEGLSPLDVVSLTLSNRIAENRKKNEEEKKAKDEKRYVCFLLFGSYNAKFQTIY